jgi:hypothetical protein
MIRKTLFSCLAVILLIGLVSCTSSKKPPQETIAATGGTPQSATIATAFAKVLSATVTTGTTDDSGVAVTFTAPATGASGTFAGGGATATATTNSSGVATSPVFTANNTAGTYTVTATASGASGNATFTLTNTAGAPASIAVVSGNNQSTAVNTAFTSPLVVSVEDASSNPVSGVVVTFTPPAAGASATFSGGVNTASTGANGQASISASANDTVGGPYTVAATAAGVAGEADFSLTNTTSTVTTQNFVFYAAGNDVFNDSNYTIAGSVTIDNNGNVLSGVQDFNDGVGLTSPESSGDSITGGSLQVDASGNGTLALTTNNANWPAETLAVVFVNSDHALIAQFDDIATSIGSLDLQTIATTPAGSFSFVAAGYDSKSEPLASGGVFTVSNGVMTGAIDIDKGGSTVLDSAFGGSMADPDPATGRGIITGSSLGITVAYYVVGAEAVRFIVVDTTNTALGSAFGQGNSAGSFSPASIGQSVLSVSGTPVFVSYVLAGQFTTDSGSQTFSGYADVDEYGSVVSASSISGTYSMGTDGYGSLTITNAGALDASVFGVYAVDPNININDPNNPTGAGGALVADLDTSVLGIGVLVPQTDVAAADFTGSYAFDGQFNTPNDEADFLGLGTVSGTSFSGSGYLNDPYDDFVTTPLNSGVTFSGTLVADGTVPGRYTLSPLDMTVSGTPAFTLAVAAYQASGAQLFWIEEDSESLFSGQLQQQPVAASVVKKAARKSPLKR